jgi:hypothetical protein
MRRAGRRNGLVRYRRPVRIPIGLGRGRRLVVVIAVGASRRRIPLIVV